MSKPAPKSNRPSISQPLAGFAYSQSFFQDLTHSALQHAKKLGATDAACEASEGCGLSVSSRLGELENVERNRDKSLGVTVYVGQRRGNASTSDFSPTAIQQTVQAAFDIARFTAADDMAGLPEITEYAQFTKGKQPDLDLFHPWDLTSEQALTLVQRCEAAAMGTDKRVTNSEGAGVSAQQSHFWTAHWRSALGGKSAAQGIAFEGGYASSRHSLSVAPIAGKGEHMQQASWHTSMRDATLMSSPEAIGRYAAERALARLHARKLSTRTCAVLFESSMAVGLLGGYVQATSGGALYRKTTFLADSLGKTVFPKHIQILDDPSVLGGKGSAPFDEEGVQTQTRQVVQDGKVAGYFLSSYSARKLGMKSTGNAGGSHNLMLMSTKTKAADDLDAMLKKLGTGLFVTELMGQGVNYVTGDYSRGASGYWVENGQIAYPVHEITIAGNLKDMFQGIQSVGSDTYNYGAKTIGSVLINRMKVAGSAA
jgi:PmbA protein